LDSVSVARPQLGRERLAVGTQIDGHIILAVTDSPNWAIGRHQGLNLGTDAPTVFDGVVALDDLQALRMRDDVTQRRAVCLEVVRERGHNPTHGSLASHTPANSSAWSAPYWPMASLSE
jgi:hypothetical protein